MFQFLPFQFPVLAHGISGKWRIKLDIINIRFQDIDSGTQHCEHNPMIEIKPVPAFQDNYIWMLINPDDGSTAIVDPGDATPVLDFINKKSLKPVAILTTHHHGDHVGGVNRLLQHFDIPVYGPANENIPHRTVALREGDRVELPALSARFDILDVPGHTSGHIAYYGQGCLFIGDTLFMAGCGRLFEGTADQMYVSLNKIRNLPDETRIYCAHEYTLANLKFALSVEPDNADITARLKHSEALRKEHIPTVPDTLAVEKKTNPFLRTSVDSVIKAAASHAGHDLNNGTAVFAAVRKWKDGF